jgi:DNA-binding XRE family transcriptional regulator
MERLIEYTVIEHEGKPSQALVDHAQFMELLAQVKAEPTVPHEVVKLVYGEAELPPVKAWRKYRDMSQTEVAHAMGITQAGYSLMEKPEANLRKATRAKIAKALEISVGQLDV